MHFTKSLVFVAALGAGNVVGRATHKHRHAELHEEKRAVGDMVTATIDGKVVSWVNEYSGGASPTSTSDSSAELRAAQQGVYKSTPPKSSAVAAAVYSAKPSASSTAGTYKAFCAPSTSYKNKRVTAEQVAYKGNVGSTWGCNIMVVDASVADKYKYVLKVSGQNTESWNFRCWNKIGRTGLLDGWYNDNYAISFQLDPGQVKYVAFDENTQASCSAAPGTSIPKDSYGGYGGTWLEVDLGNTSNNKWSGCDVSSIQAEAGNLKVYGMQAKYNGQTSTIGENLSVVSNAFDYAKRYEDGIGFNIPAGSVSLEVVVDWKG